jgi:hypothetical protein
MNKWRIIVGILLVFALGTAAGAYGSRMMFKKRVSSVLHAKGPPGSWAMQRMFRRLDLSETQRKSIDAILDESNTKWETIQEEFEPRMKALFDKVIEDTKKELTPQQREKLERMSENIRRRLPQRPSSWKKTAEPRPMSRSIGQEHGGMPGTAIVDRLKIDKEKSAEVQEIIQADVKHRDALMAQFRSAIEPLESELRKDLAAAQTETEKKLEDILSADQMHTYRQLMRRNFYLDREFRFDAPPKSVEQNDLN